MKYLGIILLFTLAACSRNNYPQFLLTKVKDTTITRIEYKDTVVRVAAKSTIVTKDLPGDCPDFDTTIKKGTTTVNVSKQGKQLKVECHEDSLKLVIEGLLKNQFQVRTITTEVPVPVETEVPYIPKWMWYALGILAALAGWGNRKIIAKLFLRITGLWTI